MELHPKDYKGCSGVVGVGEYFTTLERLDLGQSNENESRGRSNTGQEVVTTSGGGKQQCQT
eukprot:7659842-Ditylum_brightwellii.AAC.1